MKCFSYHTDGYRCSSKQYTLKVKDEIISNLLCMQKNMRFVDYLLLMYFSWAKALILLVMMEYVNVN